MSDSPLIRGVFFLLMLGWLPLPAAAQPYPYKPIRFVTSQPGGGTDYAARVVGNELSAALGQPVVVENRGGGVYSGEIVSKATPDGYTLLVTGTSFWVGPLFRKTPYDPLRDFAPVSLLVQSPNVLVVYPALPVKSVRDLIDLAKSKPGQLNYASASTGSSSHLAAELFKAMASVNLVRIAYKGTGQSLIDLMAGRVQLSFATSSGAEPHIKSGRLRAIAVTSARPSALFPGVPTVAEIVPGYVSGGGTAMLAPPHTPAAVMRRLSQETTAILHKASVKGQFLKRGAEVVASSPAELAEMMKEEAGRIEKLIKETGIETER
ncbi:MAG: tripartite tricarboxylate transporter substrate binding protein [Betaproteobacteria bacterium]|nr:tripartite tricarboxylate transporter substrate binding protein [Betaproteobacteria bacterium]